MEKKKGHVVMQGLLFSLLFFGSLILSCSVWAADKEPYKVGLSTARTGPAAIGYTPSSEGFRIYIEKLNDAGGINGHPVKVMMEDDGGVGAKAGSNIMKFAEAGAHIIMLTSVSATYAPAIAEAKRANIPIIMAAGSISPPDANPPKPEPLVFSATDKSALSEPYKSIAPISQLAKGPVTLGIVVMDLPMSSMIAKKDRELAEAKGWKVVESKFPMSAVDLTSIADEWIQKGVNWGVEHGPAGARLLYPALMKRGWKGNFLLISEAFNFLTELKADNLYADVAVAPFELNLPQHKEVIEAAKKYNASILATESLWGWNAARVLESILKKAGWPVNTTKLLEVMNNFECDNRPLDKVVKWTSTDHAGPFVWRVYHWDKKQGKVAPATGWFRADSLGTKVEEVGPNL